MRSTFFVILSLFIHALCVLAIAIHPVNVSAPEGNSDIEVQIGEEAEQPGLETATDAVTEAAAPVTAEPELPVPETVAKASEQKTKVITAPMEKVTRSKPMKPKKAPKPVPMAAAPTVPEAAAPTPVIDETGNLDSEIEGGGDAIPAAPAAAETPESDGEEASTAEEEIAETPATGAPTTAPSSTASTAPATAPVAQSLTPGEDTTLAKGGATQAGAVSYLNLKQAPGNRSPLYPLQARRESRQGQVELLYRVTKEGKVTDVQVAKSSGHKDLDQEAARAVAQFKFVPGQECWARHPVAFTLKGDTAPMPSRLRSAQTE